MKPPFKQLAALVGITVAITAIFNGASPGLILAVFLGWIIVTDYYIAKNSNR